MFIYWGIFLILATGAALNQEQKSGTARVMFVVFASLPTTLMIGLRWKIGPDWSDYLDQFNYTKLFSFDQVLKLVDPGFFALNWAVHQLAQPFWVLNLVCGAIFVTGLTAFCARQPNPWLAFLVAFPYLVIVVAMSGNRQSVALGFLFLALNAFEDGRLNWFALLTILAALFHGSVLLMLPLCMLSYASNSLQRAFLLVVAVGLAYYFFGETFSTYARRYSMEKIQSTGVAYRLAMNAAAAILFLLLNRRFDFDEHQRRLWRNISLTTLLLALLLVIVPSSTAVDRFLLYLFPLQFVVFSRLPRVVSTERQAPGQVTLAVIGYAALVQLTFLYFGTYAYDYVPYRSILTS